MAKLRIEIEAGKKQAVAEVLDYLKKEILLGAKARNTVFAGGIYNSKSVKLNTEGDYED